MTIVLSLTLLCFASWIMNKDAKQRIYLYEIDRYTTQFHSSPVVESWSRITQAWRIEQNRNDELSSRIERSFGTEKIAHIQNYQHFVLDTVDDYALQADIETVLHFFDRLTLCVRVGGCDPLEVTKLFGVALHQFHNRLSYYFEFEGIETDSDKMLSVILFP